MRKIVYSLSALVLLSMIACGEDTVGQDTGQCEFGERRNPISNICEPARGENSRTNSTPNNENSGTNNANNRNNTSTNNTTTCTDCAVFFRPEEIAFTYTPVRESSSVDVELVSQIDTNAVVSRIEWEGATGNEFATFGVEAAATITPQGTRQVTVQFSPQDLTDDTVTLRVYFEGISTPAELKITTTVTGTDVCTENCPRIQVSPPAVRISYQPGDPAIQRTVIMGSVGDTALEVREILLVQQGRAYSIMTDALPLTLRPQQTSNIDISFDTSVGGSPEGRLLIRSSDPFTPEIEVPIRASSKDASTDPCISVAPTSLNFGTVQRGQVVVKNFTITNCGPVDLNVTDIQRGAFFGIQTTAAYSLTGWSRGVIPSGGSQTVEVTYQPRRAGFDNGSFTVRSNAVNNAAVRVNVRGTSKPPPLADQDIHIEVEWDSDQTDVDTHVLLLPGQGLFCGNDCYFQNPAPDWGVQGDWQDDPFLDVDDVDGYGPENVNIEKGIDNMIYRVVLHYWDDSYDGSFSSSSNVTVKLFIGGTLTQTWGPIALSGTGDTKDVFEIAWPSRAITTFNNPIYSVPSSTSCRATP